MADNDIGGVWRTIGGRRVFIKTGQSLSDAMIASGKFSRVAKNQDLYKKLEDEKKEFTSQELKDKYGTDDVDLINTGKEKENRVGLKKETSKYDVDPEFAKSRHIGFSSFNKDGVPVYDGKIDNKGDFGWADLSTLSDEELTTALNTQSQEYKLAVNETLGDQRTRNGKMDKIFNTAKQQKYEEGMKKISAEMEKRDMPRYNIYNDKNGMLMVSSPTKEMADTQLKEMMETDKSLQKEYGWKELPSYSVKKENNAQTNKGFGTTELNEGKDFVQETTMHGGEYTYTAEQVKRMEENGIRPMKSSYTGGGWEGVNSNTHMDTKDQAKAITDTMKQKYPDVKISRKTELFSGGSAINFNVMSSDNDLFITDKDIDNMSMDQALDTVHNSIGGYTNMDNWFKQNVPNYQTGKSYTDKEVKSYLKSQLNDYRGRSEIQGVSGGEWYLSNYGKGVMRDLNKTANSYTYSDSDGMVDYFDHGTYMHVSIGKWNKPYEVSKKTSSSSMNNALRQKAYEKYMKEHPNSKKTFEEFMKK